MLLKKRSIHSKLKWKEIANTWLTNYCKKNNKLEEKCSNMVE